jgi:hypothetical protein
MHQLFTGETPHRVFGSGGDDEALRDSLLEELSADPTWRWLVSECLDLNPAHRPSFAKLQEWLALLLQQDDLL